MSEVGKTIALIRALGTPTDAQVTSAVEGWLDDHPEATTTVTDGSITNAKLASSFVTPGTAAAYSSSATYAVGDYVFHNGSLYRFVAPHSAGAWNASDVTAVNVADELGDVKSQIDNQLLATDEKTVARIVTPTVVDGKLCNTSGTISNNSSYYYFEVSDLQEGDVVSARSFYNNTTSIVVPYFRYVCAYNSAGSAVPASGVESVLGSYTVPSGITKVAITIQSTYPLESVVHLHAADVFDKHVNANLDSVAFASYPNSVSGAIAASGSLTFDANCVKKNKAILFNGDIDAFNSLSIGQGLNGSDGNSSRIVIDTTNVSYYRGTGAAVSEAHGLTFADYLSVTITVGEDHLPTVTIMTNGGSFTHKFNTTWVGCFFKIFAVADASTSFSAATLGYVCRDVDKPLWVFGDSYVSYTGDRWPYPIAQMGFTGYLLNGYAGEPSPYAIRDLLDLLNYGTPKYLLWDLGMNDADTSTAVNYNWISVWNELVGICNAKGITLIACTIPNVPTRNNSFKNAVVEASGYKYIDFATAVGAHDDTTWYTGMLSSDGLHPTIDGANALAAQVLKDFPYICIK